MKNRAAILCVALLSLWGKQSGGADGGQCIGLGYYENMSCMSLIYALGVRERETNTAAHAAITREISYIMFSYWAHTRLGDLRRSSMVENAVQHAYRDLCIGIPFDEEKIVEDPLGWRGAETPLLSPPKPLADTVQSGYEKALVSYMKFLQGKEVDGNPAIENLGKQQQSGSEGPGLHNLQSPATNTPAQPPVRNMGRIESADKNRR